MAGFILCRPHVLYLRMSVVIYKRKMYPLADCAKAFFSVAASQTNDAKIQHFYSPNRLFYDLLVSIGRALRVPLTFERLNGKVQLNKPITARGQMCK